MSQAYPDAKIFKANGAEFFYIEYPDGRFGQGCYELCLAAKEGKIEEYIEKCRAERERLGIGMDRVITRRQAKPKTEKPPKPVQLSLF